MENQIRIKRAEEDLYRINIADDGTEIVFDLADISLALKCDKAFNKVEANRKRALAQVDVIEKKYQNQPSNEKLKNQETIEIHKVLNDMFNQNRVIMDNFFGCPGAMQKLFGDSNYIDMYADLYEQLEPHFEKMGMNVEKIAERIKRKYGKKENVIK